jgi:hypothetical protein
VTLNIFLINFFGPLAAKIRCKGLVTEAHMAGEDVNSDHASKEGSSSRTMNSVTLGRGGGLFFKAQVVSK